MFGFRRKSKTAAASEKTTKPEKGKSFQLPQIFRVNNGGQPKWRDWSTEKATQEGYLRSTWLYDAVELRRKAVASIPWHVETRDRDGDWQRAPDHPLQSLLDEPNPDFTTRELMGRLVQWLDLGGNAYWMKVRAGQRSVPAELWPAPPDKIAAVPGGPESGHMIAQYRFEMGSVKRTIEREDMIHFAYPSPSDMFYGVSPVQAASMAVDIDTESQEFQKVSLQNRGVPDGVFTLRGDGITREEWEAAREQVREQYQGADAHRAPWVVGHAEWTQMSLSPVDLDYVNSRKESRLEILSALGIPPPLVSIFEDATLANAQTARKVFWADTVVPLLEELADTLNASLVPEFAARSELRIVYDTSNVEALRQDLGEKIEAAKTLWEMGAPLNTVSQRFDLGLDDIPGGDVGYISAGKLPVTGGSDSGGASSGDDDVPAGGGLDDSQVNTILSIIQQVAAGQLPRETAVTVIAQSFPLSEQEADDMLGEVGRSFFSDGDPSGGTGEGDTDDGEADPEQRSTLPGEVKRRVYAYREQAPERLARLAYGDD